MKTAIEAAHNNNRKRSLEDLDAGVLAASTRGPVESRRRSWQEICEAWGLPPWPITVENIRAVAASLKAGGYQSAQLYFDAAIWYQTHILQEQVPPTTRRLVKSYTRSIKRGTPSAQLKAAFPLLEVAVVARPTTFTEAYDPTRTTHAADALILATWFMLREKEMAAARVRDLHLILTTEPQQIQLTIPLHKTAIGGDAQITQRRLKCACTTTTRPLCPACAGRRHLNRLHQGQLGDPDGPLFPTADGQVPTREQNIQLIRRVLEASGIPVDYDDGMGHHKPTYGGHAARVAGAHFLAAQGVPMAVIQILGRWSSSAIERYVQAAPMALAPDVPSMALAGRAGGGGPTASTAQSIIPATVPYSTQEEPPTVPDSPTKAAQRPPNETTLVPDMRPEEALRAIGAEITHHIVHARTGKTHRPDPAEDTVGQTLWKAPCGWRYGGYRYYRQTGTPAEATRCKKCWRSDPTTIDDDEDQSVASSSGSSDSSTSESSS